MQVSQTLYAKRSIDNTIYKMDQFNKKQQILRYEQNKLLDSYLKNQINQTIKFSCILDLYDVIQENAHLPDEQIQQLYEQPLMHRNNRAIMENSIEEINDQLRILQNNEETFFSKILRCLGILKKIMVQPISKYIINLFIQKYVTQFVWDRTRYCLYPQVAAGLTSLTFGLFYLRQKDSKKFLHENYLWCLGSSMFIYFNIQQNIKEVSSLSIGN